MSRTIDALIATHVFGWKGVHPNSLGHVMWIDPTKEDSDQDYQKEYGGKIEKYEGNFNPSTKIQDAWLVVEKIADGDRNWFNLEWFYKDSWRADFFGTESGNSEHYQAVSNTAPMAICLAALKALGVKYE